MNLRATQKFKARRLGGPGCSQKRGPKNQQGTWGFCEQLKRSCRSPTFVAWTFKLGTGMAKKKRAEERSLPRHLGVSWCIQSWPSHHQAQGWSLAIRRWWIVCFGIFTDRRTIACCSAEPDQAGHILVMIQPETILDPLKTHLCQRWKITRYLIVKSHEIHLNPIKSLSLEVP